MSRNSSMWLDYQRWRRENGLLLLNDEPDDLTSLDYDDPPTLHRTPRLDMRSQEEAHADELPFDATADEDMPEHDWAEIGDTGEPEYLRRFRCRTCHKIDVLPPDWTPDMLDQRGCW